MLNKSSETLQFFRAWISEPLRVASVTPSGQALADLIVSEVSPEAGPILELGPGTGVFTRALLARGVAEENLALIEFGSEFAAKLNADFPRAKTLWMNAARVRDVVLFDGRPAGAVISGLPLLSMSPRAVYSILEGAFMHLRANGAFYQFTYGPRCPVSRTLLDRLGLKATYLGGTFANLPPAAVYRIQRRKHLRVQDAAVGSP
ncbi:class I SAM-dependent methyltransferase [Aquabacter sp. P-9]|uniref:class I SAM-dependent methyltransferase n=1 Tax=Aquabacter sediminis TaxID=3029197 RepID=UPI00237DA9F7|nr:phospholipid methyltransferase [Aquabacter sp. P-9]MDE1567076.1 phospholipid methyltransferase [Aquabacter sp. P-9]